MIGNVKIWTKEEEGFPQRRLRVLNEKVRGQPGVGGAMDASGGKMGSPLGKVGIRNMLLD